MHLSIVSIVPSGVLALFGQVVLPQDRPADVAPEATVERRVEDLRARCLDLDSERGLHALAEGLADARVVVLGEVHEDGGSYCAKTWLVRALHEHLVRFFEPLAPKEECAHDLDTLRELGAGLSKLSFESDPERPRRLREAAERLLAGIDAVRVRSSPRTAPGSSPSRDRPTAGDRLRGVARAGREPAGTRSRNHGDLDQPPR